MVTADRASDTEPPKKWPPSTPARVAIMIDAPGDIVEVLWVDSAGHGEWHAPEQARELLDKIECRSVGYLLEDDERGVVILLGAGAIGQYLGSMAIPRQAILSLSRLPSETGDE